MKSSFVKATVVICSLASLFSSAYAQDPVQINKLKDVFQAYTSIKDALVSGDKSLAAQNAKAFVGQINSTSLQLISEGNVSALVKDASAIADGKDINIQRQYFANFSANMAELVKVLKVPGQVVYIQYCPMKKASWLSNEQAIKNPYYGNAMLSCGKVTDTIQ